MAEPLSEWRDISATDRMLQRHGFSVADGRAVLCEALLNGTVQFRIARELCPPDKLYLVSFDADTGLIHGWRPGGLIVMLPENWCGDEHSANRQPATIDDGGAAGEFNLVQLGRHLRELREIEGPVAKRPNLGGRPGSWNWGKAMIALAAHMLENKSPESPAPFAAFLRAWFAQESGGERPDDKLIRQWAKDAYTSWTVPRG